MLAIIVFTIIIATYFSSQINNRNIGSTSQAIPLTLALVGEFRFHFTTDSEI